MSNVEHRGVRTDEQWEADRMEVIRRAFESDEMIVMTRDLPEQDDEGCEMCGELNGVRVFGIDHTLLCARHYAEAERNVLGAEYAAPQERRSLTWWQRLRQWLA